jgi:phosphoglycerol transferase MdoB-like AlkP superfamily enzyme
MAPKEKSTRNRAVRYTDWCLGQFFEKAKKETFWTNTIFVVVADHGARVYGSQKIPIRSYEIPLVILGPAAVKQAERIGTLGNSLDVSPTVLGMIGRPYETLFFGRDLLKDADDRARVLLNHNRDIGMFARDRMVVLSLQKSVEYYSGNPKVEQQQPVADPDSDFLELEKDASALYQVADDLYMHRQYRIDGVPMTGSSSNEATRHASSKEF